MKDIIYNPLDAPHIRFDELSVGDRVVEAVIGDCVVVDVNRNAQTVNIAQEDDTYTISNMGCLSRVDVTKDNFPADGEVFCKRTNRVVYRHHYYPNMLHFGESLYSIPLKKERYENERDQMAARYRQPPDTSVPSYNGIPLKAGVNHCHYNISGKCSNPKIPRVTPSDSGCDQDSRQNCTYTILGMLLCHGCKIVRPSGDLGEVDFPMKQKFDGIKVGDWVSIDEGQGIISQKRVSKLITIPVKGFCTGESGPYGEHNADNVFDMDGNQVSPQPRKVTATNIIPKHEVMVTIPLEGTISSLPGYDKGFVLRCKVEKYLIDYQDVTESVQNYVKELI